jgi:ectoine hydroxylase
MTKLTPKQLNQYEGDGYIVLKGMLSPEQIFLLSRTAREDRVLDQHSFGKADGEGGTVRLSLWNHPTDSI